MVTIVGYTAVDDCGYVLDHVIVEGQVHGGLAQGLGQVLFENAVYDADSGQLVAGSFMDYAHAARPPHAADPGRPAQRAGHHQSARREGRGRRRHHRLARRPR